MQEARGRISEREQATEAVRGPEMRECVSVRRRDGSDTWAHWDAA